MVTNAHVVWPYDNAYVVFPNGEVHRNIPIRNWDLMRDLAVLGPITTDVVPATLANGEEGAIGSETYLIGYPVGMESGLPQPTITRGLISRLREWRAAEITYFQSDATIEAGQSGGVIVSDKGDVIGISGHSLGDFAISASMNDLLPRIIELIEGKNVSGFGQRRVPMEGGATKQRFPLDNRWAEQAFVIDASAGETVLLRLHGAEGYYTVYNSQGIQSEFTQREDAVSSIDIEHDVPHFLIAWHESHDPNTYMVESDRDLIPFDDPDDGRQVQAGQIILGNIDYPTDRDYYRIDIDARSKVEITVDSLRIDPKLWVVFRGAITEEVVSDDDSGGGMWGRNAQVTYRAPFTTSYFIVIEDATGEFRTGGYVLSVRDVTGR